MSAFNNGGGDLKSTNLPAAILEMVKLIEIKEGEQSSETKLTTLSTNHQSDTTTFSGSIDCTEVNYEEGTLVEAVDYIGLPFNPGTDGDLTATTYPAALHQLLNLAITAQQAAGVSAISISANQITKIRSYSGSIPIIDSIDANGDSVTSAVEIF